jgi:hypothetical protein
MCVLTSAVARAAVGAGADIVNDVSGGRFDPDMLKAVADMGVPVVLMHSRGTPQTMAGLAQYDSVLGEVQVRGWWVGAQGGVGQARSHARRGRHRVLIMSVCRG